MFVTSSGTCLLYYTKRQGAAPLLQISSKIQLAAKPLKEELKEDTGVMQSGKNSHHLSAYYTTGTIRDRHTARIYTLGTLSNELLIT